MKYLIVVDMQNDFITGSLGTKEAQEILPKVIEKAQNYDGTVVYTRDTHTEDYLNTQEGKKLPVMHCILSEPGWNLDEKLQKVVAKRNSKIYQKPTFGCIELVRDLERTNRKEAIEEIELCGLCTDICVISNALLIKAYMPEVPVCVDASCCAGVTPKSHKNALEAMKMCQITIKNDEEEAE